MQTHMKLVTFAFFLFTLSHSSAHPTIGASPLKSAGIHERLKQDLQQWTTGSSRSSRKLLQEDSQGETLLEAVKSQEYSDVEDLLRAGADPSYITENGIDALAVAVINDRGDVVTLLIEYGADVKGSPGSRMLKDGPLQLSTLYDATEAAAALLEAGLSIDSLNESGLSALHVAALEGNVKLVDFLLNNGATVDLYTDTRDPSTALHIAAVNKHLAVAKLLISKGADVNSPAKRTGDTPLHDAAQENSALIIQELLDNGAEINSMDVNGATPLWDAAFVGNKKALEVLVINGADKSIIAYDFTPKEVLCACAAVDDVPEQCQVEICKSRRAVMEQLLMD